MTIDMLGARPLAERDVSPAMRTWAKAILTDSKTYPLGSVTVIEPGIVARVEIHRFVGATGEKRPDGLRGVSLYHLASHSPRPVGVDVSGYQPSIDWPRVAASGVSYVFVKSTEGMTVSNALFGAQWAGAKSVGLLRGAYCFMRVNSGVPQIQRFVDSLGSDVGELPPVLDVEWHHAAPRELDGVAPSRFADVTEACIAELARLTGRKPLLYSAPGFMSLLPVRPGLADACDLSIAKYGTEPKPDAIPPWKRWLFWQYSSTADISGVGQDDKRDDANLFAGTLDELRAYAGGAEMPKPIAPPLDLSTVRGQQTALAALGYPLTVDGDFGAKTRAAVAAFQRAHPPLKADSVPGPLTQAALRAALDAKPA